MGNSCLLFVFLLVVESNNSLKGVVSGGSQSTFNGYDLLMCGVSIYISMDGCTISIKKNLINFICILTAVSVMPRLRSIRKTLGNLSKYVAHYRCLSLTLCHMFKYVLFYLRKLCCRRKCLDGRSTLTIYSL